MRTGKNRTFVVDHERLEETEARREEGKGLVGGSIDKIPHVRRGLRPHIDLEEVAEILRECHDPELLEKQQNYLKHRPLDVEIGFGGGEFLFHKAQQHPDVHFVGFEIRRYLCLALVRQVDEAKLDNLRVCYEDVRQSMPSLIADQSIRRCSVFFPDPWWKRRHIKRRLLTPSFLDLMTQKLEPKGVLHIKTDVLEYGEQVELMFAEDDRFAFADASYDHLFEGDHPTQREAYCTARGLPFVDLRYVLK